jgi:hypothetical protein
MRLILFNVLLLIAAILQHSCIEPYIPDNQNDFVPRIVVEGLMTDESENQTIKLSYTSRIDSLKYSPVSGCFVEVFDNLGNCYSFQELYPGNYEGVIPLHNLLPGREFQLHFITTNGDEYESNFEKFNPCPAIESIHYIMDTRETSDPLVSFQGLQFYYDFYGSEEFDRYFRLTVEETWEYRAKYPITVYYSYGFQKTKADSSLFFCYNTNSINDIFLISTKGFEKNEYVNYQLHFVDNQTQRLKYKYSLLIKQYSISEAAHSFWVNLEKNNQQSGGLFETQPAVVEGNINCINAPNESVLGYFGVSSVNEKRIFVEKPDGITFIEEYSCEPSKPNFEGGWPGNLTPDEWPIYFIYYFDIYAENTILGIAPQECFDCTKRGGTTHKPNFW